MAALDLRQHFESLSPLELWQFQEIFQEIGLLRSDIQEVLQQSNAMKDGLVDCVKVFDWICPGAVEQECSQDIMGAMPPPASPLEEEEVSPSGRWLATQQLFDFEKIEAAMTEVTTPEQLLQNVAGNGCSIPVVEDRAIQLRQLGFVLACIRCGCNQHGWSDAEGRRLTWKMVNLYHLVNLLVKPATASRECSFVELVAEGPQPCKWFVSHWWGEAVCDFFACLMQHSKDRALERKSLYYWVCAYANNQWNVSDEIGEDPSNSSFRRAMRKAAGTVSIVDKDAKCYTRVWCIYETYVSTLEQRAHQGGGYLFDIYTNENQDSSEAVGITDGVAIADGTGPKQARRKRHREWRFPFELIQKALDIKVEQALASEESDRRMILNSIAGVKDLASVPSSSHPGYDELNDVLHGRFSAASFCKASALDSVDLARHASALSCSQLQHLCLHFGGDCLEKLTDDAVVILAQNLPDALVDLFLGFQGCRKLTDISAIALGNALHRLKKLQKLEIRFSSGPKISDDGIQGLANGLPAAKDSLQWLSLDLQNKGNKTKTSEAGCAALAESLDELRLLQKAHISLASSSKALQRSLKRLGCQLPVNQSADETSDWNQQPRNTDL